MFPIRRAHQDPCPSTKRVHRVSRYSVFQDRRCGLAFFLRVADVAGKMLLEDVCLRT